MSVSSVGSSLLSSSSLSNLLGTSSLSTSGASGLLGTSSSAGDAVSVDLSDIAKAASSGDSSTRAADVAQLKTDLAGEQASLLAGLTGSAVSSNDVGDNLLAKLYAGSSLGSLMSQSQGSSGTTVDTTA